MVISKVKLSCVKTSHYSTSGRIIPAAGNLILVFMLVRD